MKTSLSLFALCASAFAQEPLTISQAVANALRNYPSIQVSQEQIDAAAAGIQLARTAYLPRVDALAQVNRATRNNVFGLLLPQSVIPSMSGPVIGTNNFGTAWGSAIGALVTWEPFDFGLRHANIAARSGPSPIRSGAEAHPVSRSPSHTADAYLTLAAAQETVRPRRPEWTAPRSLLRTISALVERALRPGADASRAEAELAAARTQLIQAQQAREIARATRLAIRGYRARARSRSPRPSAQDCRPDSAVTPLDPAANPIAVGADAPPSSRPQAQLQSSGAILFPALLCAGFRVCARHGRRNQRATAGRSQRTGSQCPELCAWIHA